MSEVIYKRVDGYTFVKPINQPFQYKINSFDVLYISKYQKNGKHSIYVCRNLTGSAIDVYRKSDLTLEECFEDAVNYINSYMESLTGLNTSFGANKVYFYKGVDYTFYDSSHEFKFRIRHSKRIKSFLQLNDACRITGYSLQNDHTNYTITIKGDYVNNIKDCHNHYKDVINFFDNYGE